MNTEEKELYTAYITARDAWIAYIRPQAIKKINDYLVASGRLYDNNDYFMWCNDILFSGASDSKSYKKKHITPEIIAKYKKLCILFHPDKFNKPSASSLFQIIKSLYENGSYEVLNSIDTISHLILELPLDSLKIFTANLENPEIQEFLTTAVSNNTTDKIMQILINTDPLLEIDGKSGKSTTNNKSNNFLDSIAYKFYMNDSDIKDYIQRTILTEAEIIEKIKGCNKYDSQYITFCKERYSNNENISQAVKDWYISQSMELQKENDKLRELINARLSHKD